MLCKRSIAKAISRQKQRNKARMQEIANSGIVTVNNSNKEDTVNSNQIPGNSATGRANLVLTDEELAGDKRQFFVNQMKTVLRGTLNLERILATDVIIQFNMDGNQGKMCLKMYDNFLKALFDATAREGVTYAEFTSQLRSIFGKVKNRVCKQYQRLKKTKNVEN